MAVVDQKDAERRLGQDLCQAPAHALDGPPLTAMRFDRIVPEAVALRLATPDGAQLAFDSQTEYVVNRQALRRDRLLTPESGALLGALIRSEPHVPEELKHARDHPSQCALVVVAHMDLDTSDPDARKATAGHSTRCPTGAPTTRT
jgi:hypothetical protein